MIDEPLAESTPATDWKLEVGEGTLAPRSALDVLTTLNEQVASGRVEEFMPIATGDVKPDGMTLRWIRGDRNEMLRRANEKPDVLLVDDNLCVHTDARFG